MAAKYSPYRFNRKPLPGEVVHMLGFGGFTLCGGFAEPLVWVALLHYDAKYVTCPDCLKMLPPPKSPTPKKRLYEILVPTIRGGRPVRLRCHRQWDDQVRKISGGLTVMTPAKGTWVCDGEVYKERMIPVRIMCTAEQIEKIADMTAKHYEQKAVMFYCITNEVRIKHYSK